MPTDIGDREPRDSRLIMIEDELASLESRHEWEKKLRSILVDLETTLRRLSSYPADLTVFSLDDGEPLSVIELHCETETLIERTDERIKVVVAKITLLKGMLKKVVNNI